MMKTPVKVGFAALCLALGSRWLLDQAWPGDLPSLLRVAVHQAVLLVVFGGLALWRRAWVGAGWWRVAIWLGVLFWLPSALIAGAGGTVGGLSEALVFTLVPVAVVFVEAQMRSGFGEEDGARGLLGPAVAGVAGAGLVIPFTMPGSLEGRLWLAGLVVSALLAGVAAVRLHTLLRGVPVVGAVALSCGFGVVAGGLVSAGSWRVLAAAGGPSLAVEAGIALLVEGPLLALTMWLLREMSPIPLSARYGVILLVTILETAALMRPGLGWELGLGLLLMAVSAGWLLRAELLPD